jgi:hypothetical protein
MVLQWLKEYLFDRSQSVKIGNTISIPSKLKFGVPQGSILGPLLFTMYTTPLSQLILKYDVDFHFYADDTQLYLPIDEKSESSSIVKVENCISEIKEWMSFNKLKFNDEKTEVIIFGNRFQRPKIISDNLKVGTSTIQPTKCVRNLGVYFDEKLTMKDHIIKVCQACYFHLRNIRKMRHYLDEDITKMLVHAFIISRLDYCNALFSGLPHYLLHKLQKIQNKCARIITCTNNDTHLKPILKDLHWLPVQERIEFKIMCHVLNINNNNAPTYLRDLLEPYRPMRNLRSKDNNLLNILPSKTVFGERAFSVCAPQLWNRLSIETKNCNTISSFKKRLKTELFRRAYDTL